MSVQNILIAKNTLLAEEFDEDFHRLFGNTISTRNQQCSTSRIRSRLPVVTKFLNLSEFKIHS